MTHADQVTSFARSWLGTPFVNGACAIGYGCDCLGLIRGLWAQVTGRPFGSVPPYDVGMRQGAAHDHLLAVLSPRFMAVPQAAPIMAGQILVFALRGAAGGETFGGVCGGGPYDPCLCALRRC